MILPIMKLLQLPMYRFIWRITDKKENLIIIEGIKINQKHPP